MAKKELPVFIFNGFLDSGKTTLMRDILESDEAYHNNQVLVILTEEGLEALQGEWLHMYKINLVTVEDESEITPDYLDSLVKKYKPSQLFMEMNAFINYDELQFPDYFVVYQQVTLFDATKFDLYYKNMKQQVNQMSKFSSIIIFNRCDGMDNLGSFRRMIRAFNQQAQVGFETSDGKIITTLEEDLPYDLKNDKIVLADDDYPVWYLDVFDNQDKYKGKEITFRAYVRDITEHTLVVGRQIMTCCEADIQFYGYEVIADEIVKNNSFIELTCEVTREYSYISKQEELMLKAHKITVLDNQKEQYLTFK